jgi:hypothetical protein
MATGRRVAVTVRGALLAAVVMLVSLAPAWADGCSLQDLWNGIEATASAITSGACASACSDGVGCGAAAAIATSLGGVAADSSQGTVNNFCNAVQTAINDVQNAGNDATSIQNALSQAGINAQDVAGTILGALNGIADPLNAAACGCSLEQGVGQLGGDVLSCMQSAICGLQEDLGWGGCGCTPPPPVAGNCSPSAAACGDYNANQNSPECQNAIYGRLGDNPPPVVTQQLSNGTLIVNVVDGWDGHSATCSPDSYCFCPSPMQVVAVPNYQADGGNTNNGYVIYVCECPPGTKAAQQSGPGADVCLCDNTGLPAVPPVKSTTNPEASICPIPLTGIPCPNGEQYLGGKCVKECSNPNEGMTIDGACCDPAHMTSCGICCPPGTTPEPDGSCFSPGPIQ